MDLFPSSCHIYSFTFPCVRMVGVWSLPLLRQCWWQTLQGSQEPLIPGMSALPFQWSITLWPSCRQWNMVDVMVVIFTVVTCCIWWRFLLCSEILSLPGFDGLAASWQLSLWLFLSWKNLRLWVQLLTENWLQQPPPCKWIFPWLSLQMIPKAVWTMKLNKARVIFLVSFTGIFLLIV